jgi:hypothetical protein
MGAFADMAAAEARAKAKGPAGDRTWLYAHPARRADGTIVVRFIRYMTVAASPQNGAWVDTNDDTVT